MMLTLMSLKMNAVSKVGHNFFHPVQLLFICITPGAATPSSAADTSIETPQEEVEKKEVKVVPETQGLSFDNLQGDGSFWGDFNDTIEEDEQKGTVVCYAMNPVFQ